MRIRNETFPFAAGYIRVSGAQHEVRVRTYSIQLGAYRPHPPTVRRTNDLTGAARTLPVAVAAALTAARPSLRCDRLSSSDGSGSLAPPLPPPTDAGVAFEVRCDAQLCEHFECGFRARNAPQPQPFSSLPQSRLSPLMKVALCDRSCTASS